MLYPITHVLCRAITASQCPSMKGTMAARTFSGGSWHMLHSLRMCVSVQSLHVYFIWKLCFTVSRYGVGIQIFTLLYHLIYQDWGGCVVDNGTIVATFFPKKAGCTHRLNGWSLRCQHTKMSIKWKVSLWTASGDDNWSSSWKKYFVNIFFKTCR